MKRKNLLKGYVLSSRDSIDIEKLGSINENYFFDYSLAKSAFDLILNNPNRSRDCDAALMFAASFNQDINDLYSKGSLNKFASSQSKDNLISSIDAECGEDTLMLSALAGIVNFCDVSFVKTAAEGMRRSHIIGRGLRAWFNRFFSRGDEQKRTVLDDAYQTGAMRTFYNARIIGHLKGVLSRILSGSGRVNILPSLFDSANIRIFQDALNGDLMREAEGIAFMKSSESKLNAAQNWAVKASRAYAVREYANYTDSQFRDMVTGISEDQDFINKFMEDKYFCAALLDERGPSYLGLYINSPSYRRYADDQSERFLPSSTGVGVNRQITEQGGSQSDVSRQIGVDDDTINKVLREEMANKSSLQEPVKTLYVRLLNFTGGSQSLISKILDDVESKTAYEDSEFSTNSNFATFDSRGKMGIYKALIGGSEAFAAATQNPSVLQQADGIYAFNMETGGSIEKAEAMLYFYWRSTYGGLFTQTTTSQPESPRPAGGPSPSGPSQTRKTAPGEEPPFKSPTTKGPIPTFVGAPLPTDQPIHLNYELPRELFYSGKKGDEDVSVKINVKGDELYALLMSEESKAGAIEADVKKMINSLILPSKSFDEFVKNVNTVCLFIKKSCFLGVKSIEHLNTCAEGLFKIAKPVFEYLKNNEDKLEREDLAKVRLTYKNAASNFLHPVYSPSSYAEGDSTFGVLRPTNLGMYANVYRAPDGSAKRDAIRSYDGDYTKEIGIDLGRSTLQHIGRFREIKDAIKAFVKNDQGVYVLTSVSKMNGRNPNPNHNVPVEFLKSIGFDFEKLNDYMNITPDSSFEVTTPEVTTPKPAKPPTSWSNIDPGSDTKGGPNIFEGEGPTSFVDPTTEKPLSEEDSSTVEPLSEEDSSTVEPLSEEPSAVEPSTVEPSSEGDSSYSEIAKSIGKARSYFVHKNISDKVSAINVAIENIDSLNAGYFSEMQDALFSSGGFLSSSKIDVYLEVLSVLSPVEFGPLYDLAKIVVGFKASSSKFKKLASNEKSKLNGDKASDYRDVIDDLMSLDPQSDFSKSRQITTSLVIGLSEITSSVSEILKTIKPASIEDFVVYCFEKVQESSTEDNSAFAEAYQALLSLSSTAQNFLQGDVISVEDIMNSACLELKDKKMIVIRTTSEKTGEEEDREAEIRNDDDSSDSEEDDDSSRAEKKKNRAAVKKNKSKIETLRSEKALYKKRLEEVEDELLALGLDVSDMDDDDENRDDLILTIGDLEVEQENLQELIAEIDEKIEKLKDKNKEKSEADKVKPKKKNAYLSSDMKSFARIMYDQSRDFLSGIPLFGNLSQMDIDSEVSSGNANDSMVFKYNYIDAHNLLLSFYNGGGLGAVRENASKFLENYEDCKVIEDIKTLSDALESLLLESSRSLYESSILGELNGRSNADEIVHYEKDNGYLKYCASYDKVLSLYKDLLDSFLIAEDGKVIKQKFKAKVDALSAVKEVEETDSETGEVSKVSVPVYSSNVDSALSEFDISAGIFFENAKALGLGTNKAKFEAETFDQTLARAMRNTTGDIEYMNFLRRLTKFIKELGFNFVNKSRMVSLREGVSFSTVFDGVLHEPHDKCDFIPNEAGMKFVKIILGDEKFERAVNFIEKGIIDIADIKTKATKSAAPNMSFYYKFVKKLNSALDKKYSEFLKSEFESMTLEDFKGSTIRSLIRSDLGAQSLFRYYELYRNENFRDVEYREDGTEVYSDIPEEQKHMVIATRGENKVFRMVSGVYTKKGTLTAKYVKYFAEKFAKNLFFERVIGADGESSDSVATYDTLERSYLVSTFNRAKNLIIDEMNFDIKSYSDEVKNSDEPDSERITEVSNLIRSLNKVKKLIVDYLEKSENVEKIISVVLESMSEIENIGFPIPIDFLRSIGLPEEIYQDMLALKLSLEQDTDSTSLTEKRTMFILRDWFNSFKDSQKVPYFKRNTSGSRVAFDSYKSFIMFFSDIARGTEKSIPESLKGLTYENFFEKMMTIDSEGRYEQSGDRKYIPGKTDLVADFPEIRNALEDHLIVELVIAIVKESYESKGFSSPESFEFKIRSIDLTTEDGYKKLGELVRGTAAPVDKIPVDKAIIRKFFYENTKPSVMSNEMEGYGDPISVSFGKSGRIRSVEISGLSNSIIESFETVQELEDQIKALEGVTISDFSLNKKEEELVLPKEEIVKLRMLMSQSGKTFSGKQAHQVFREYKSIIVKERLEKLEEIKSRFGSKEYIPKVNEVSSGMIDRVVRRCFAGLFTQNMVEEGLVASVSRTISSSIRSAIASENFFKLSRIMSPLTPGGIPQRIETYLRELPYQARTNKLTRNLRKLEDIAAIITFAARSVLLEIFSTEEFDIGKNTLEYEKNRQVKIDKRELLRAERERDIFESSKNPAQNLYESGDYGKVMPMGVMYLTAEEKADIDRSIKVDRYTAGNPYAADEAFEIYERRFARIKGLEMKEDVSDLALSFGPLFEAKVEERYSEQNLEGLDFYIKIQKKREIESQVISEIASDPKNRMTEDAARELIYEYRAYRYRMPEVAEYIQRVTDDVILNRIEMKSNGFLDADPYDQVEVRREVVSRLRDDAEQAKKDPTASKEKKMILDLVNAEDERLEAAKSVSEEMNLLYAEKQGELVTLVEEQSRLLGYKNEDEGRTPYKLSFLPLDKPSIVDGRVRLTRRSIDHAGSFSSKMIRGYYINNHKEIFPEEIEIHNRGQIKYRDEDRNILKPLEDATQEKSEQAVEEIARGFYDIERSYYEKLKDIASRHPGFNSKFEKEVFDSVSSVKMKSLLPTISSPLRILRYKNCKLSGASRNIFLKERAIATGMGLTEDVISQMENFLSDRAGISALVKRTSESVSGLKSRIERSSQRLEASDFELVKSEYSAKLSEDIAAILSEKGANVSNAAGVPDAIANAERKVVAIDEFDNEILESEIESVIRSVKEKITEANSKELNIILEEINNEESILNVRIKDYYKANRLKMGAIKRTREDILKSKEKISKKEKELELLKAREEKLAFSLSEGDGDLDVKSLCSDSISRLKSMSSSGNLPEYIEGDAEYYKALFFADFSIKRSRFLEKLNIFLKDEVEMSQILGNKDVKEVYENLFLKMLEPGNVISEEIFAHDFFIKDGVFNDSYTFLTGNRNGRIAERVKAVDSLSASEARAVFFILEHFFERFYKGGSTNRPNKAFGLDLFTQDARFLSKHNLEFSKSRTLIPSKRNISPFDGEIEILKGMGVPNSIVSNIEFVQKEILGWVPSAEDSEDIEDIFEQQRVSRKNSEGEDEEFSVYTFKSFDYSKALRGTDFESSCYKVFRARILPMFFFEGDLSGYAEVREDALNAFLKAISESSKREIMIKDYSNDEVEFVLADNFEKDYNQQEEDYRTAIGELRSYTEVRKPIRIRYPNLVKDIIRKTISILNYFDMIHFETSGLEGEALEKNINKYKPFPSVSVESNKQKYMFMKNTDTIRSSIKSTKDTSRTIEISFAKNPYQNKKGNISISYESLKPFLEGKSFGTYNKAYALIELIKNQFKGEDADLVFDIRIDADNAYKLSRVRRNSGKSRIGYSYKKYIPKDKLTSKNFSRTIKDNDLSKIDSFSKAMRDSFDISLEEIATTELSQGYENNPIPGRSGEFYSIEFKFMLFLAKHDRVSVKSSDLVKDFLDHFDYFKGEAKSELNYFKEDIHDESISQKERDDAQERVYILEDIIQSMTPKLKNNIKKNIENMGNVLNFIAKYISADIYYSFREPKGSSAVYAYGPVPAKYIEGREEGDDFSDEDSSGSSGLVIFDTSTKKYDTPIINEILDKDSQVITSTGLNSTYHRIFQKIEAIEGRITGRESLQKTLEGEIDERLRSSIEEGLKLLDGGVSIISLAESDYVNMAFEMMHAASSGKSMASFGISSEIEKQIKDVVIAIDSGTKNDNVLDFVRTLSAMITSSVVSMRAALSRVSRAYRFFDYNQSDEELVNEFVFVTNAMFNEDTLTSFWTSTFVSGKSADVESNFVQAAKLLKDIFSVYKTIAIFRHENFGDIQGLLERLDQMFEFSLAAINRFYSHKEDDSDNHIVLYNFYRKNFLATLKDAGSDEFALSLHLGIINSVSEVKFSDLDKSRGYRILSREGLDYSIAGRKDKGFYQGKSKNIAIAVASAAKVLYPETIDISDKYVDTSGSYFSSLGVIASRLADHSGYFESARERAGEEGLSREDLVERRRDAAKQARDVARSKIKEMSLNAKREIINDFASIFYDSLTFMEGDFVEQDTREITRFGQKSEVPVFCGLRNYDETREEFVFSEEERKKNRKIKDGQQRSFFVAFSTPERLSYALSRLIEFDDSDPEILKHVESLYDNLKKVNQATKLDLFDQERSKKIDSMVGEAKSNLPKLEKELKKLQDEIERYPKSQREEDRIVRYNKSQIDKHQDEIKRHEEEIIAHKEEIAKAKNNKNQEAENYATGQLNHSEKQIAWRKDAIVKAEDLIKSIEDGTYKKIRSDLSKELRIKSKSVDSARYRTRSGDRYRAVKKSVNSFRKTIMKFFFDGIGMGLLSAIQDLQNDSRGQSNFSRFMSNMQRDIPGVMNILRDFEVAKKKGAFVSEPETVEDLNSKYSPLSLDTSEGGMHEDLKDLGAFDLRIEDLTQIVSDIESDMYSLAAEILKSRMEDFREFSDINIYAEEGVSEDKKDVYQEELRKIVDASKSLSSLYGYFSNIKNIRSVHIKNFFNNVARFDSLRDAIEMMTNQSDDRKVLTMEHKSTLPVLKSRFLKLERLVSSKVLQLREYVVIKNNVDAEKTLRSLDSHISRINRLEKEAEVLEREIKVLTGEEGIFTKGSEEVKSQIMEIFEQSAESINQARQIQVDVFNNLDEDLKEFAISTLEDFDFVASKPKKANLSLIQIDEYINSENSETKEKGIEFLSELLIDMMSFKKREKRALRVHLEVLDKKREKVEELNKTSSRKISYDVLKDPEFRNFSKSYEKEDLENYEESLNNLQPLIEATAKVESLIGDRDRSISLKKGAFLGQVFKRMNETKENFSVRNPKSSSIGAVFDSKVNERYALLDKNMDFELLMEKKREIEEEVISELALDPENGMTEDEVRELIREYKAHYVARTIDADDAIRIYVAISESLSIAAETDDGLFKSKERSLSERLQYSDSASESISIIRKNKARLSEIASAEMSSGKGKIDQIKDLTKDTLTVLNRTIFSGSTATLKRLIRESLGDADKSSESTLMSILDYLVELARVGVELDRVDQEIFESEISNPYVEGSTLSFNYLDYIDNDADPEKDIPAAEDAFRRGSNERRALMMSSLSEEISRVVSDMKISKTIPYEDKGRNVKKHVSPANEIMLSLNLEETIKGEEFEISEVISDLSGKIRAFLESEDLYRESKAVSSQDIEDIESSILSKITDIVSRYQESVAYFRNMYDNLMKRKEIFMNLANDDIFATASLRKKQRRKLKNKNKEKDEVSNSEIKPADTEARLEAELKEKREMGKFVGGLGSRRQYLLRLRPYFYMRPNIYEAPSAEHGKTVRQLDEFKTTPKNLVSYPQDLSDLRHDYRLTQAKFKIIEDSLDNVKKMGSLSVDDSGVQDFSEEKEKIYLVIDEETKKLKSSIRKDVMIRRLSKRLSLRPDDLVDGIIAQYPEHMKKSSRLAVIRREIESFGQRKNDIVSAMQNSPAFAAQMKDVQSRFSMDNHDAIDKVISDILQEKQDKKKKYTKINGVIFSSSSKLFYDYISDVKINSFVEMMSKNTSKESIVRHVMPYFYRIRNYLQSMGDLASNSQDTRVFKLDRYSDTLSMLSSTESALASYIMTAGESASATGGFVESKHLSNVISVASKIMNNKNSNEGIINIAKFCTAICMMSFVLSMKNAASEFESLSTRMSRGVLENDSAIEASEMRYYMDISYKCRKAFLSIFPHIEVLRSFGDDTEYSRLISEELSGLVDMYDSKSLDSRHIKSAIGAIESIFSYGSDKYNILKKNYDSRKEDEDITINEHFSFSEGYMTIENIIIFKKEIVKFASNLFGDPNDLSIMPKIDELYGLISDKLTAEEISISSSHCGAETLRLISVRSAMRYQTDGKKFNFRDVILKRNEIALRIAEMVVDAKSEIVFGDEELEVSFGGKRVPSGRFLEYERLISSSLKNLCGIELIGKTGFAINAKNYGVTAKDVFSKISMYSGRDKVKILKRNPQAISDLVRFNSDSKFYEIDSSVISIPQDMLFEDGVLDESRKRYSETILVGKAFVSSMRAKFESAVSTTDLSDEEFIRSNDLKVKFLSKLFSLSEDKADLIRKLRDITINSSILLSSMKADIDNITSTAKTFAFRLLFPDEEDIVNLVRLIDDKVESPKLEDHFNALVTIETLISSTIPAVKSLNDIANKLEMKKDPKGKLLEISNYGMYNKPEGFFDLEKLRESLSGKADMVNRIKNEDYEFTFHYFLKVFADVLIPNLEGAAYSENLDTREYFVDFDRSGILSEFSNYKLEDVSNLMRNALILNLEKINEGRDSEITEADINSASETRLMNIAGSEKIFDYKKYLLALSGEKSSKRKTANITKIIKDLVSFENSEGSSALKPIENILRNIENSKSEMLRIESDKASSMYSKNFVFSLIYDSARKIDQEIESAIEMVINAQGLSPLAFGLYQVWNVGGIGDENKIRSIVGDDNFNRLILGGETGYYASIEDISSEEVEKYSKFFNDNYKGNIEDDIFRIFSVLYRFVNGYAYRSNVPKPNIGSNIDSVSLYIKKSAEVEEGGHFEIAKASLVKYIFTYAIPASYSIIQNIMSEDEKTITKTNMGKAINGCIDAIYLGQNDFSSEISKALGEDISSVQDSLNDILNSLPEAEGFAEEIASSVSVLREDENLANVLSSVRSMVSETDDKFILGDRDETYAALEIVKNKIIEIDALISDPKYIDIKILTGILKESRDKVASEEGSGSLSERQFFGDDEAYVENEDAQTGNFGLDIEGAGESIEMLREMMTNFAEFCESFPYLEEGAGLGEDGYERLVAVEKGTALVLEGAHSSLIGFLENAIEIGAIDDYREVESLQEESVEFSETSFDKVRTEDSYEEPKGIFDTDVDFSEANEETIENRMKIFIQGVKLAEQGAEEAETISFNFDSFVLQEAIEGVIEGRDKLSEEEEGLYDAVEKVLIDYVFEGNQEDVTESMSDIMREYITRFLKLISSGSGPDDDDDGGGKGTKKAKYETLDQLKANADGIYYAFNKDHKFVFVRGGGNEPTMSEMTPDIKVDNRGNERKKGNTYHGISILGDFYRHNTILDETKKKDYADIIIVDNFEDIEKQLEAYKAGGTKQFHDDVVYPGSDNDTDGLGDEYSEDVSFHEDDSDEVDSEGESENEGKVRAAIRNAYRELFELESLFDPLDEISKHTSEDYLKQSDAEIEKVYDTFKRLIDKSDLDDEQADGIKNLIKTYYADDMVPLGADIFDDCKSFFYNYIDKKIGLKNITEDDIDILRSYTISFCEELFKPFYGNYIKYLISEGLLSKEIVNRDVDRFLNRVYRINKDYIKYSSIEEMVNHIFLGSTADRVLSMIDAYDQQLLSPKEFQRGFMRFLTDSDTHREIFGDSYDYSRHSEYRYVMKTIGEMFIQFVFEKEPFEIEDDDPYLDILKRFNSIGNRTLLEIEEDDKNHFPIPVMIKDDSEEFLEAEVTFDEDEEDDSEEFLEAEVTFDEDEEDDSGEFLEAEAAFNEDNPFDNISKEIAEEVKVSIFNKTVKVKGKKRKRSFNDSIKVVLSREELKDVDSAQRDAINRGMELIVGTVGAFHDTVARNISEAIVNKSGFKDAKSKKQAFDGIRTMSKAAIEDISIRLAVTDTLVVASKGRELSEESFDLYFSGKRILHHLEKVVDAVLRAGFKYAKDFRQLFEKLPKDGDTLDLDRLLTEAQIDNIADIMNSSSDIISDSNSEIATIFQAES